MLDEIHGNQAHKMLEPHRAVDYTQVSNVLILKETEVVGFRNEIKQNQ